MEDGVEITRKDLEPDVVVLELNGPLQMGVECKRLELAVGEIERDLVLQNLIGRKQLVEGR